VLHTEQSAYTVLPGRAHITYASLEFRLCESIDFAVGFHSLNCHSTRGVMGRMAKLNCLLITANVGSIFEDVSINVIGFYPTTPFCTYAQDQ